MYIDSKRLDASMPARRAPGLMAMAIILGACASGEQRPDRPPVVEVFACSDYCPGPREQYLKNVYEGIADAESCEAIGGKPYSYIGWGNYFVCLAD